MSQSHNTLAAKAALKHAADAEHFVEQIVDQCCLAAAAEESGMADIRDSVALLRQAGWLDDDGMKDPALTADRLRRVAGANLPLGRLFEGHINALYLARIHGDARTAAQVDALVSEGAFLGVWGADGAAPVIPAPNGYALAGHKVYASGLGTVTHAVFTVSAGPEVRLGLVEVGEPQRADASSWQMAGMRATASGRYDFEGIALNDILWIGGPGDYLVEPHFVGGVWRIGALQVGGTLGLLDAAAADLRARDRLDAPAQIARLSSVVIHALGASALVPWGTLGRSWDIGERKRGPFEVQVWILIDL